MKAVIKSVLEYMLSLERPAKRVIILALDIVMLSFAYYFALALDHGNFSISFFEIDITHYLVTLIISLFLLFTLGFYTAVTRFVSFSILVTTTLSSALAGLANYVVGMVFSISYISFSSAVIFSLILCISLGGSRLLVRSYFSFRLNTEKKQVLIYGAGSAGRQLALSLLNGSEFYPVAFIDDDKSLDGVYVQGIKVFSPDSIRDVCKKNSIEKILLALPSISRAQRKLIINKLEKVGVPVQTIPGMSDIVSGKMKIDEFQDVDIEDLLGRDPIPPINELLNENINSKTVMVTGAGGSIGSELCRQIITLSPKSLVLYDLSEFNLYSIDKELQEYCELNNLNISIKPVLGNVNDQDKLQSIMKTFSVNTIYHAAAYKHVPMVEHNVVEGIKNNVFGTLSAATAAISANVESFVLISTDKAVRPTNVMGASKRVAELILQGLSTKTKETCFSMVRFGNVLGSSGSVVPLFKKQIKSGGPVTVTHPDITRYFMTIPEAAQLVIQAGAMSKGGDVFVLDMGEPVKIVELAEKLILLMGLEIKNKNNPDGDIEISFSGLRPGEKLYEELLIGNNVQGTVHPRIMTANEVFLPWDEIETCLDKLLEACKVNDQEEIRKILISMPTDFTPHDGISDLLWVNENRNSSLDNVVTISQNKI